MKKQPEKMSTADNVVAIIGLLFFIGMFYKCTSDYNFEEKRILTPEEKKRIEDILSQSDDYDKYKLSFLAAGDKLYRFTCTKDNFFIIPFYKSTKSYKPIYYTYCGSETNNNRIYLNVETNKISYGHLEYIDQ